MKENEYQCENCGGIFEFDEDWTEEMKWGEYERNFPGEPHETKAVVCEDCYKMMISAMPPPGMKKRHLFRLKIKKSLLWRILNFKRWEGMKAWVEECEVRVNKELEEMIIETLIAGTSKIWIKYDK